jgi:hypothetical protein
MEFHADKNHMYIKARKDLEKAWVQKKYKITEEDIQLVIWDWEPDWKVLAEGDVTM